MIKVEHIETWGFEHAIRGMRNPMNSWEKSDSYKTHIEDVETLETADFQFFLGEADLALMQRLFKGGTEHRKFMRQIFISLDITAPLYWWKEFDTYKVGTVANSCSTMHKIQAKEFTLDDFSHEHLMNEGDNTWLGGFSDLVVNGLNSAREKFLETKDKRYWWQMIQLLPTSYNQKRTITMTYENAAAMIHQREHHKLDEWIAFTDILKGLPYLMDIMGAAKE